MSTRAVYTFTDESGDCFHVYKHHDGYPSGAAEWIENAKSIAWALPRFEADEFAASFVAANKPDEGGVRLMPTGKIADVAPMDIAYWYDVKPKGKALMVTCYEIDNWDGKFKKKKKFAGTLEGLAEYAKEKEMA